MDSCDSPTSRDSAIKLFGKEIPLMESRISPKSPMEIDNGLMKIEHKTSPQSSRSKVDQAEKNDRDQEKVFKKPDKILPCPRCNSLETKFCYFNNYNVNQPRHFCKNCQRYWTAGGTVRNVPMGSGRRKNKQFASQYRQILVSSNGTPIINMDSSDSTNIRNATVLKFGPDAPVSESMDSLQPSGEQNRHEEQEQEVFANRSKDEPVNALPKEQIGIQASCNELNTQNSVPFYPLPPWGYPVNQSWNNLAAVTPNGVNSSPVQLCHGQFVAIPVPQGIPLQFLPASYLACRSVLGNLSNSASMNNCMSPSSSTSNSGGGSPTLGKHSREPSSMLEEAQTEKYVLIPKSLRIDAHEAVTKSSVWATTSGSMPKHESPLSKGMVFKGLESKVEGSNLLEANLGVLSRPHMFK